MMGTRRYQKISDAEICQLYRDGQSAGVIGLRARISSVQVRDILTAHGIRIRQSAEALRLHLRTAPRRASTERARIRQRMSDA